MTAGNWIALGAALTPIVLACIAALVWLVRVEARVSANADASRQMIEATAQALIAKIDASNARIDLLEAKAVAHEDTKIEVVRLQEQIKHLTQLIEKWFQPVDPPAAKRRRAATAQG
jgi:cell shape-determining protein MreC